MVAGGGAGAWLLLGGGASDPEEPVPDLAWTLAPVRSVPVDGDAPEQALEGARQGVADLLDGLYTTAFIDPEEWQGGAFPSLGSYFAGNAARRAMRDKDSLTLGSDAAQVERVQPRRSRLRLSFLVDPQARPYAAIAVTNFRASGRTSAGQGLAIVHEGRYVVRQVDGAWRIVGYDVDGSVETVAASPEGEAQ